MRDIDYGKIEIHLNELIEKSGLSKNNVTNRANMQRTQLNNYCNKKIQRIDLDILTRLCYALDCSVEDILKYVPPDK